MKRPSIARKTMALAATLTLTLGVAGCGKGASTDAEGGQSYQWDFTITTGQTSTWYEGAERFAEILDEKSDGRMKVNIFTNEQLSGGDPAAGVEQLMNGDKAFSYNSTIIYAGLDPKFGAINAPFLYSDIDQAEAAIDAGAADAYEELSSSAGVKMLGFGESGFRQLTNNVRAVDDPEDLNGVKMRIPGIGLFTDAYNLLGADPTTMDFAEVFTALQQGTIDGQENPIDIIYTSGLDEVQDYLTIWNYVYDPLILGMNEDLFDSLSEEDQQIVLDAAAEANELQITNNREREADELDELRDSMEVTELTPEQQQAFAETMQPLYDQYQSIWGADLAKAVQPRS